MLPTGRSAGGQSLPMAKTAITCIRDALSRLGFGGDWSLAMLAAAFSASGSPTATTAAPSSTTPDRSLSEAVSEMLLLLLEFDPKSGVCSSALRGIASNRELR
jgi:hypothetical protein